MLAPRERVRLAIARGKRTRDAIRLSTKLDYDVVMDLIAELWDSGTVRVKRVDGEAIFVLAA